MLLASGRPRSLTYIGTTTDTTNTNAYTFSGASIGAASGDRRVIVLVLGEGSTVTTLSSASIGGVSADIVVQGSNGQCTAAIIIAAVPTGTTGDIVCTFSNTKAHCNIGVYRTIGLPANTATDTGASTADPATDTLTTTVGGFALALAGSTTPTSLTWTNITEDYDETLEAAGCASGASIATTGANISPSGDYASAAGDESAVFATW